MQRHRAVSVQHARYATLHDLQLVLQARPRLVAVGKILRRRQRALLLPRWMRQDDKRRRFRGHGLMATAEYMREYRSKNRDRVRNHNKNWIARNPEHAKRLMRRRGWRAQGIDVAQAEAMLANHSGKCDICRTTKPGGRGDWHVDHNHSTGRLRGILCSLCNSHLGRIERIGLAQFSKYLAMTDGIADKK